MCTFCSTSSICEPGARDRQPIQRAQTQRARRFASAWHVISVDWTSQVQAWRLSRLDRHRRGHVPAEAGVDLVRRDDDHEGHVALLVLAQRLDAAHFARDLQAGIASKAMLGRRDPVYCKSRFCASLVVPRSRGTTSVLLVRLRSPYQRHVDMSDIGARGQDRYGLLA